jgi:hypothetical protein
MTVVVGEKLFLLHPLLLLLLPVFFQYQLTNLRVLFFKRIL